MYTRISSTLTFRTLSIIGCLMFFSYCFAADIEHSTKTDFLTPDVENIETHYGVVAAMGKVHIPIVKKESTEHQKLVAAISDSFLNYTSYFLKPKFLPSIDYVKENMIFVEDVRYTVGDDSYEEQRIADVTYLTLHFDEVDILVSQLGETEGDIGISFSINKNIPSYVGNSEKAKDYIAELIETYIVEDKRAPLELSLQDSKKIADIKLVSAKINPRGVLKSYKDTLRGVYSKEGVTLVFEKHIWHENIEDPTQNDALGVPKLVVSDGLYFEYITDTDNFLNPQFNAAPQKETP